MEEWKKRLLIIFSIVFGISIFLIAFGNFSFVDVLSSFKNTELKYVIGFIIASLVIQILHTIRWMIVLKYQNINIGFTKAFLYRLAGYSISYITPGPRVGGEPVSAALMKRDNIPFMQALSGIAIDKVIDTIASGIFFILGGLILLLTVTLAHNIKIFLIVMVLLFAIGITLFFMRLVRGKYFFTKIFRILFLHKVGFIKKYEDNVRYFENVMIDFYKLKKWYFAAAFFMCVLAWIAMYFEYFFVSKMIGVPIGIKQIFLIVSFVGVALLTPVPMALGTMEAGQIGAFAIFGVKQSSALALSLIIRARDFLIVAAGFIVVSYYGLNITRLWKSASGYESVNIDVNGKKMDIKVKSDQTDDFIDVKKINKYRKR